MSEPENDVFAAANDEADRILDWLSERNISPRVAAVALLITTAGLIMNAANDRAEFERLLAGHQNVFTNAANNLFDAKEAETATKQ